MTIREAYQLLGISPPGTMEQICSAYAQAAKSCNPEMDSQGWMKMHEAFKLLKSQLERKTEYTVSQSGVGADAFPAEENTFGEFDEIFTHLEDKIRQEELLHPEVLAKEREAQRTEQLQLLCDSVEALCSASRGQQLQRMQLETLFTSEAFRSLQDDPEGVNAVILLFCFMPSQLTKEACSLLTDMAVKLLTVKGISQKNANALRAWLRRVKAQPVRSSSENVSGIANLLGSLLGILIALAFVYICCEGSFVSACCLIVCIVTGFLGAIMMVRVYKKTERLSMKVIRWLLAAAASFCGIILFW